MDNVDKLGFVSSPNVEYAGNYFQNVPIILQYDETPLIEVMQTVTIGWTAQFSIYNRDGVHLARTRGAQMYKTADGEKAGIRLLHPEGMTVCELDGQTLFKVLRKGAAAVCIDAELYAPDGRFMRVNTVGMPESLVRADGSSLTVGGIRMWGNQFVGCRIGVRVGSDGSLRIGG